MPEFGEKYFLNKEEKLSKEPLKKTPQIEKEKKVLELTKDIRSHWDWNVGEKLLTDWKKDLEERFEECGRSHFSPDGKKVAVWVIDKKRQTIAINGQTWDKWFKECEDPHFSPDGTKVAAIVRDKEGWTIAINGQTWDEGFEECENLQFSPDGMKIMVVVKKEGKYYRIVKEV